MRAQVYSEPEKKNEKKRANVRDVRFQLARLNRKRHKFQRLICDCDLRELQMLRTKPATRTCDFDRAIGLQIALAIWRAN